MNQKIEIIKKWLQQTENKIESHSIYVNGKNGLISPKLVEEGKDLLNTKIVLKKVLSILEDK
jgi:hypothetical protein